jgi:hypothetical protein
MPQVDMPAHSGTVQRPFGRSDSRRSVAKGGHRQAIDSPRTRAATKYLGPHSIRPMHEGSVEGAPGEYTLSQKVVRRSALKAAQGAARL